MTDFTDGHWHRLHPATPLLRGGIALIAILGFMVVQWRDQFIGSVIGSPTDEEDPWAWLLEHELFLPISLAIGLGLALFIGGFYLSWRMHTFRITEEVVEVRSGILFRTNRKARLDRIQGINIVRPFLARLFGAARLEVNVAGQDANVQLDYLGSASADQLRADILRLASGTREAVASPASAGGEENPIRERVAELLAPELDPRSVAPQSVVSMNLGRVLGSLVLSNATLVVIAAIIGIIVSVSLTGQAIFLVGILPGLIGVASYYSARFSRSLRFTIASTADGIRIGYGLLSTTNETLPPGRIHSVQVSQPLLWRPAGWWEIKVNRAAKSSTKGAANQANTTILPVGNREDVIKVLSLVLPSLSTELVTAGLDARPGHDGYTNSPRRAALRRPFSWRRNGFAIADEAVLLRTGAVWRHLVIVPLARLQSVALESGWLSRLLRLATLKLHTVAGPISPVIGAVDAAQARSFFDRVATAAVIQGSRDTSQRWRAGG